MGSPATPEQGVQADGGERAAGAEGEPGEHDGERLERDGDAEAAYRDGRNQG
jgi:hypothetical protein